VIEEPQEPAPPVPGRGGKMVERRIDIQPAEDEEDPDDGLRSVRRNKQNFFLNLIYFEIRYLTSIIFDVTRITIWATNTNNMIPWYDGRPCCHMLC
jgi:hypothetical protein